MGFTYKVLLKLDTNMTQGKLHKDAVVAKQLQQYTGFAQDYSGKSSGALVQQ